MRLGPHIYVGERCGREGRERIVRKSDPVGSPWKVGRRLRWLPGLAI